MAKARVSDQPWQLEPHDAERLRELLAVCPRDCASSDPRFLAVLDAWEAANAPHDAEPAVHGYRTKGGGWLVGYGVATVLAAVGVHVGTDAPGAHIDALREYLADPAGQSASASYRRRRG